LEVNSLKAKAKSNQTPHSATQITKIFMPNAQFVPPGSSCNWADLSKTATADVDDRCWICCSRTAVF